MTKVSLRLFLDEGVARSVGRAFEARGHEVIYLHEAIATGSSDLLVCAAAEANDAILVAQDGDMRQIAKGHGVSNSRYKKLSLIKLSCNEVRAAHRVEQFMDLIEAEWLYSQGKAARRLFVDIGDSRVTVFR